MKKNDSSASSIDPAHINQEMYKKSVELKERNETLSLLQKIDEIILSDLTHLNEIAEKVTSLLVSDSDFLMVSLFLYDKKASLLQRIAFSQTASSNAEPPYSSQIALSDTDNSIVQVVNEKISKTVSSGSTRLFIYPLIVRGEVIGAMIFGMQESEDDLSQYHRDLLDRLTIIIGIALDNAILYNEVQASNEKLKELDKLKDEFVSLASHELRTPMTAVKSYLWMALDGRGGELNEKQKYYLDRAYTSVDRLINLVNEMLNISRIESGKIIVSLQPVALEKVVQDVIDEVLPRANELGVTVEKIDGESLPQVMADSDKLKEVVINLVGNSMKFTPQGGTITVSFSRDGDMIVTTVKDNGAGISPENLPKLFQKFGMLADSYEASNASMASGTGLGLYTCKAIIELHGGKIWATSEGKGKGSEFAFSLKVANGG